MVIFINKIGVMSKTYNRLRLFKVISLALNSFVPNCWEYKVIPSLTEKKIFFKFKEKYDFDDEINKALNYCKKFE